MNAIEQKNKLENFIQSCNNWSWSQDDPKPFAALVYEGYNEKICNIANKMDLSISTIKRWGEAKSWPLKNIQIFVVNELKDEATNQLRSFCDEVEARTIIDQFSAADVLGNWLSLIKSKTSSVAEWLQSLVNWPLEDPLRAGASKYPKSPLIKRVLKRPFSLAGAIRTFELHVAEDELQTLCVSGKLIQEEEHAEKIRVNGRLNFRRKDGTLTEGLDIQLDIVPRTDGEARNTPPESDIEFDEFLKKQNLSLDDLTPEWSFSPPK